MSYGNFVTGHVGRLLTIPAGGRERLLVLIRIAAIVALVAVAAATPGFSVCPACFPC